MLRIAAVTKRLRENCASGMLTGVDEQFLRCSCQLQTVPTALGRLRNVDRLSLHNNGLTEVPDEIGDMTSLTWLCATFSSVWGCS